MKITILGNCATQTNKHETTSFLINENFTNLLIDCGPGITSQILKAKIKLTDLSGIVITHVHGDHIAGIPYLLFLISVVIFNSKENIDYKIDLYATKSVMDAAKTLVEIQYPIEKLWERFVIPHEILNNKENNIKHKDLNLNFFIVDHVVPTIGFTIIDSNNKKLVYSCDTRPTENVVIYGKDADVMIHEAFCLDSMVKMAFNTGHSTAKQAGEIAKKANARILLLCHSLSFALDNRQALIDEAKSAFGGETFIYNEFEDINI